MDLYPQDYIMPRFVGFSPLSYKPQQIPLPTTRAKLSPKNLFNDDIIKLI